MLQDELKSINSILTPEQQAKVKGLVEDKREQAAEWPSDGLPKFVVSRDSLAEHIEAAADKLKLSSEQRTQIASAACEPCRTACRREGQAPRGH